MSYCKKEGKDVIMFVTEEDHKQPSSVMFDDANFDDEPGLILDNGEINWNCPCLGGMATGPCGPPFREAFSCFHYSKEEPKGSECYDQFKAMQECMLKYPDLYDYGDKEDNDDEAAGTEVDEQNSQDTNSQDENNTESKDNASSS